MKRVAFITLLAVLVFSFSAFALDTDLMDTRNNIFREAQSIKSLLTKTKEKALWADVITINSMWDSCVLAIAQLDAYFSMLGIFNTIRPKDVKEAAVNHLVEWLKEIKKTNNLNIKSLNAVPDTVELGVQGHLRILKSYFSDLNNKIDKELIKVSALQISSKKR